MSSKEYPIGFYKQGEGAPQYAHNKKDEERLQEDGWTEGAFSIPSQDYPKMLYNERGEPRIVHNKEEEAKANGFSDKIVLPQEAPPQVQEQDAGNRGRLDELEDEIYRLKEQIKQGNVVLPQNPPRPSQGHK